MADRAFVDLVPRVLPFVSACPRETVRQHIRDAAITVCEYTHMWRYETRQFNLVAGLHYYEYNKPTNAEVVALYRAILDETTPLSILTLEQAIDRYPAWADILGGVDPLSAWDNTLPSEYNTDEFNSLTLGGNPAFVTPEDALDGASQPCVITHMTPDKFIVLPTPDTGDYVLRMFTALRPKRNATGMDEVVFYELEDAIMHRAIHTLTLMPNKPWSSAELSAYHRREARFLMNDKRAKANLTTGRGNVRVEYPGFE